MDDRGIEYKRPLSLDEVENQKARDASLKEAYRKNKERKNKNKG